MADLLLNSIAWMADAAADESRKEAVRELIAAAKSGDIAAFGRLIELHEQRVFRTARAILGNEADAKDAAQEVFLRVHRHLSRFDESRELAPWLYRITTNVCRDIARRNRRYVGEPLDSQPPASDADGPFETLAREEQISFVRPALARLPYKERAAIILRDLEGLSTRETAKALGTTQATVRSQLSSGRAKLRKHLLLHATRRKP